VVLFFVVARRQTLDRHDMTSSSRHPMIDVVA